MSDSTRRLMFLATKRFESEKAIRGAFLLTDDTTKPIEFRCTNPIRPTQLQTMLYGDILQDHILVELIGEPLVRTVKETPEVILVLEREFLGLGAKVDIPVVLITQDEHISSANGKEDEFQMLNSASGRFEPIVFSTNRDFPNDKEQIGALLTDVFNSHNLIEPFNRVTNALEQVHDQKVGDVTTS